MTDSEFIVVLKKRFRDENDQSLDFSSDSFAQDFIKRHPREVYNVLLDIFQCSIERGQRLSRGEKTLVSAVKQWPNKTTNLEHLCRCFFDSDLKD